MRTDRRTFLRTLSAATSAVALAPVLTACGRGDGPSPSSGGESDRLALPLAKPEGWDPMAFNRARGRAGAIPAAYLEQIEAEGGLTNHLGKHLPYVPALPPRAVPPGYVALMWGDPSKGHARHPNAVRRSDNGGEGHWYDWIDIRKATNGAGATARSSYPEWPGRERDPRYRVFGGGAITDEDGMNTVYLALLPEGVQPGDEIRVFAHCKTHGEYVDFVTVPADATTATTNDGEAG